MKLHRSFLISVLRVLLYVGALHRQVSTCECQITEDYLTTLVSPEFPDHYPPETRREWSFEIPPGMMGRIKVNLLQIERFWDPLILIHSHETELGTNITTFRLVSGNVTSFLLQEGVVTLQFCTDGFLLHNGFAFEVGTLPKNGTDYGIYLCSQSFFNKRLDFMCSSGLQFIDAIARCNLVVDCHDFSDEMGCQTQDARCPYRCHDSDVCLLDEFRCDGWYDCPLWDDEDNCGTVKCPDGYRCGEAPFNDKNQPTHYCGDENWQPFWVNATKAWLKDYNDKTAKKTVILYLEGIPQTLEARLFQGLHNLNHLNLASCSLTYLPPGVFDGLHRLYVLILSNNKLTVLEKGVFKHLYYLRIISLEVNQVTRFEEGCFKDLHSLFNIDLENNTITEFRPGTFEDLGSSFQRIVLKENALTAINSSLFHGIEEHLLRANLRHNLIEYIAPGTFRKLSKLNDLVLTSLSPKSIPLYPDIFEGLDNLNALYVYDPRFCCLTPERVNCVVELPTHPLFTCRKTFLQNTTIKVFMWILGISALLGNTLVLVFRLRNTPVSRVAKIQSMIITNLAVSDLLMGVYMVLLAVMDIYIGDSYFWEGRAEEWRSSTTCQIAGYIAVLSSETSVFLLTLMSVDRFISVVFPFSSMRLSVVSTRVAIAAIWIVSALLSLGGVLLNNLNPDAYGLSDVCVGLPFIRKSTDLQTTFDSRTSSQYGVSYVTTVAGSTVSTWQYSIALFLGINLVSFIAILLCYIAIFIKVRFVRAEAGRSDQSANEIKMALKMLLIVGTDFCCWMPIVILGILVQTVGAEVTPDIYAWLVVFILPINSSLNPYLYTILNMGSK